MEEAVPSEWSYISSETFQSGKHHFIQVIAPLLPCFFIFPSFFLFFFLSLSPLFHFLAHPYYFFPYICANHARYVISQRSRHNNILPVMDRFLIKGTCWLVNVNDHFVVIYSLNDNSPSIIRPLNA